VIGRIAALVADCGIVVLALALGAISWIVPKRRGEIAFYPAFAPKSFSGDLAILFEAMRDAGGENDRNVVWLTRDATIASALAPHAHLSRRRPFWALLRAELIVMDKTDLRFGFGRYRIVQVWHGAGFKRIGLEKNGLTAVRKWGLKAHFRTYRLIAASSQADAARKAICFANTNVRVTGQPRNDALVDGRAKSADLPARLGIAPGGSIIAYCPTFREAGQALPFSPEDWLSLNAVLQAQDAVFLVKRHPRDHALSVPSYLDRIRDVTADVPDVQALLAASDLLISDYSSIATDYALTEKPMIFYLYDDAVYRAHARGFHYELADILPGPFARTSAGLIGLIADRGWSTGVEYRARYERFRARFHDYLDDRSTTRLMAEIERVLA